MADPQSPSSDDPEPDPGPPRPRILVVDDEEVAREGLSLALERDYQVVAADRAESALGLLARSPFDLVVTDLRMPGMDGLQLLERLRSEWPDLPVVMVTGFAAVDTAVEAMRRGAFDYISKPYHLDAVRITLARALEARRLEAENRRLRREAERLGARDQTLVGSSAAMAKVRALVDRVADTRASVLVTGGSGTGKELVARALHAGSRRASLPFLGVNCGAIPRDLVASELFGAEKGAFTGATERRIGLFEAAAGGTVFLDEIGELDGPIQVALLRVLQQREVVRLGSSTPIPVDFRLVAATHRNLKDGLETGAFRPDLYYRIRVVEIELPDLRERPEDIPELAAHFLVRIAARDGRRAHELSTRALELLAAYPWPGNVRELENVIERAVILANGPRITPAALPEEIASGDENPEALPSLAERERAWIEEVLRRVGGNRTKAARILGLDRSSLWRKLKEYGAVSGESE